MKVISKEAEDARSGAVRAALSTVRALSRCSTEYAHQILHNAELEVMRELLCELHPKLRECGGPAGGALARYWQLVETEVRR